MQICRSTVLRVLSAACCSCAHIILVAQPAVAQARGTSTQTLARGFWIDPSTGLMWAGKDNGKGLQWRAARAYCRNFKQSGFSDWRLPTIGELQAIYDKNAHATGVNPKTRWHDAEPWVYSIKGNLFLSGKEWSSTQPLDDRGKPGGSVWYFDFFHGDASADDDTGILHGLGSFGYFRALCVRHP